MDAGTPGVGLINLLEGRQRAIIVDAAEMGRQPGEVVRFRPEDVVLTGSTERFSLHRTAVADALALAHALNLPLPEIVFFGVQPGYVGWRDETQSRGRGGDIGAGGSDSSGSGTQGGTSDE